MVEFKILNEFKFFASKLENGFKIKEETLSHPIPSIWPNSSRPGCRVSFPRTLIEATTPQSSLTARCNPRTPLPQSITAAGALLPPRLSFQASCEGKEPLGIFFDFSLALYPAFVHGVASPSKLSCKIAHVVLSVSS